MTVQANKQIGSILKDVFKGGKGSGNFGHSGRPGKVGGSGKVVVGKSAYIGAVSGGFFLGKYRGLATVL